MSMHWRFEWQTSICPYAHQSELNQFADGEELSNYEDEHPHDEEQEALSDTDGEFLLGYGHEGQVDD